MKSLNESSPHSSVSPILRPSHWSWL